jgi:hypothetical protein
VSAPGLAARLARVDWATVEAALDERGYAVTPPIVTAAECAGLQALWGQPERFRSRVDMARYRFGQGEYRYFAHPLPPPVSALRRLVYPRLVPLANRWARALGIPALYPPTLGAFLARCAAGGQRQPTPLLLRYEAGGYNCLHQDLYGPVAFPLQLTVLLSRPGADFQGGEFLLVEQRPRAQSRGEVVPLRQGQAVVFAVRERPVAGARGALRAVLRHGVSRILSGRRMSLGVIFHDAA